MSFVAFLSGFPKQFAGAMVVVAICIAIEHVATVEHYTLKQRWRGLLFTLVGGFLTGAGAWALQQAWNRTEIGNWIVIPVWDWLRPLGLLGVAVFAVISFGAYDFLAYWRHRAEHKWFWPIHVPHHSPTELHAANSWSHPLAVIPGFLFITVPLSLIQMPGPGTPIAIGWLISFSASYVHSPVDVHFGPLRRLFIDNRFHRIHHSRNPEHHEKNFGVLFSIWDAMFGTAYWPRNDEWPAVGVEGIEQPRTVADFLLLPEKVRSASDELSTPARR
jgi:sterol desaturase/sphingolipid hydroxylase (fatty acid hydroxylase superfamily)